MRSYKYYFKKLQAGYVLKNACEDWLIRIDNGMIYYQYYGYFGMRHGLYPASVEFLKYTLNFIFDIKLAGMKSNFALIDWGAKK